MYIVKIENSFDSAHFLSNYDGKCANIHGHRWKIEVEIQAKTLINDMVEDFTILKKKIKEVIDFYDHALIIEKNALRELTYNCLIEDGFRIIELPFRPTAENFSKFFFDEIERLNYDVRKITVYETPNNSASYVKEV
ncbi:6-carboxytetrahydropterin synthase QueD [Clostridium felsineum]|uniref:6-carboxytetrahydropterin synthase QueD n=1 Tax=Clostridium felsineum TaxID=36839 RepID=UPI00214D5B2C|nr:6-carboxytetrahydropterin synthase QueD [Clostridium felsineum]MCR3761342.1 6-carboxytetrahydropterin synthase QueD [Clostridium felsineum]